MPHELSAGQVGEPSQPLLSPVVIEIRNRMAKLDRVDEIVHAVNSMRVTMESMVQV